METVDFYKNKNNELKEVKNKLQNNILTLRKENEVLKNIVSGIENNFELRFHSLLSNLFTPTQIDMLLHPKLKAYKWTSDDISSAITLRSVSPKAYRYLRNKKCFPLPGRATNNEIIFLFFIIFKFRYVYFEDMGFYIHNSTWCFN